MKLKKPLAILLILALSLGVAPITGASGAIEGQSTTFQSEGTVTPEMMRAGSSEPPSNNWKPDENGKYPDKEIETIKVKVSNIYEIQVNPYGMTINIPGTNGTSTNSIVTAPIIIENRSGVRMDVSATATATAVGDVAFESKPPEPYIPSPFDDPNMVPSEERVYLYMQMTKTVNNNGTSPDWAVKEDTVITKDGGSDKIKVTMDVGTEVAPSYAALQIGGETNLPPRYGAWHLGNGFNVNIVLSFMPKQTYTVKFDAEDYWLDDWGSGLAFDVNFLVDGIPEPYVLEKGYTTTGTPRNDMSVDATQNLTFTIKTAEEPKGYCYHIREVWLILNGVVQEEPLYLWEYNAKEPQPKIVQFPYTINASQFNSGDELVIRVVLDEVTIK